MRLFKSHKKKLDYRNAILALNPIGYWSCGATVYTEGLVDLSKSAINGTIGASITCGVAGVVGTCIKNNTNTNNANYRSLVPNTGNIWSNLTAPMSLSIWFNPVNITQTNATIVEITDVGNLHISLNNGTLTLGALVDEGGESFGVSCDYVWDTMTAGEWVSKWHNVVLTFDTSNQLLFYLNGEVQATGDNAPTHNFFAPSVSGKIAIGCGNAARFTGSVDEPAVFNTVLSASDIKRLFQLSGMPSLTYSGGTLTPPEIV